MASVKKYNPNHIPPGERIECLVFSLGIITYGTLGVIFDDLYIPGKRTSGLHFHGVPCWIMYSALLAAAANLLSVIVDHYDQRKNENNYKKFAVRTRQIGWVLFILAFAADLFVYHQATKH